MALADEAHKAELGLRLIGLRMNRDRNVTDALPVSSGEKHLFKIRAADDDGPVTSLLAVVSEKELAEGIDLLRWLKDTETEKKSEITILVSAASCSENGEFFKIVENFPAVETALLSLGVYNEKKCAYRSYRYNNGWKEDKPYRGFSPLQYRELRIHRFANFNLEILTQTDSIFLIEAKAKTNEKDIRLFGLVDVAEMEPEAARNLTERLIMFETLFMEAIYAMRSVQAKYRYRLVWNRIIVHSRTILQLGMKELQEYGQKLMPLTKDLGLEKLVIYTRRQRFNEETPRELELDFIIVTEDQFNLRNRPPSNELLKPYDRYVNSAVIARQRNSVYPYEIIKMLTTIGITQDDNTIIRGDFEEFDITVNSDGSQEIISVKGREPGLNAGNVVFGIITNYNDTFPIPLRRVIILSDPTKDLGSLSETECRRVNAGLDLAEREKIPTEWIPVSSGAKITMDSGTENLDWTAATLRRIIQYTQNGGELNIIVSGVNVGAQSYWNAEATMLMHTRGLLIMTDDGAMLLTGKKALDFSGSVSGENNSDIGGAEKIMGPNGQAQVRVPNLNAAYSYLFKHYKYTYVSSGQIYPERKRTSDNVSRDVAAEPYKDFLGQGFLFSVKRRILREKNLSISDR